MHYIKQHSSKDTNPMSNLVQAVNEAAASLKHNGRLRHFYASLKWIQCAEETRDASEMEAYQTSLSLRDSHLSSRPSIASRQEAIKKYPSSLGRRCRSMCYVCSAVELPEQGRALLWTQLARFRTPLDDLRDSGQKRRELAERVAWPNAFLDHAPSNLSAVGTSKTTVEAEVRLYTDRAVEREAVIGKVRQLDGISRFLLSLIFGDLREAASEGPVIVINKSCTSLDAIIISSRAQPMHIDPIEIGRIGKTSAGSDNMPGLGKRACETSSAMFET
ncbi:hypothetical protein EDD16DRAFT_696760 [Pisolithus croceorrhizus]|nr:hypothetical protein EDD16DRAFT_696760 [Pisolithus croceorrhizus]KAI6112349.1 hypothetical protein EV401DRAFT_200262 [Pisolithus croceorrhizus]